MVDSGNLHPFFKETYAVRLQRDRQEVEIGRVTQQILMDAEIFRHRPVGADPDLTRRLGGMALHRVMELNRADLQRFVAEKLLFHLRGQQMRQRAGNIRFRL
ncbi:hypothetical protein D3C76_1267630 [compost metagenome]